VSGIILHPGSESRSFGNSRLVGNTFALGQLLYVKD
jgi:hypothetical protein